MTTARAWRMLPSVGARIPLGDVGLAFFGAVARKTARTEEAVAEQLCRMATRPHWVAAASGRAAIAAVLSAWHRERPARDEVVIPAYTSYSVPAAVVRAGLRVRLCDIERETLGLDPEALGASISDRTVCVIANHLYGLPSRIADVCRVAKAAGVPVIEDAAQALGIRCNGAPAGASGDVAMFSVSRGKILPGAGGGLVGMDDPDLAARCRAALAPTSGWRQTASEAAMTAAMAVFIRPALYRLPASLPFLKLGASWYEPEFPMEAMSPFQLSLLSRLLTHASAIRRHRYEQAYRLRAALADRNIHVLWPRSTDEGAYLRLIVLMPDRERRDRALQALTEAGLGATDGYPLPLTKLPPLAPSLTTVTACPTAEWVSERLLTLPTHPWVTARDGRLIAEVMRRCM